MPSLGEVLALLAHGLPGFEEGQQMVLDRRQAMLREQQIKAALDQMAFEQQMSEQEFGLLQAEDEREAAQAIRDAEAHALDMLTKKQAYEQQGTRFGQEQEAISRLRGAPPPGAAGQLGLDEISGLTYEDLLAFSPLYNDYIRALAALDNEGPTPGGGGDPNKPPVDTPEEVRHYLRTRYLKEVPGLQEQYTSEAIPDILESAKKGPGASVLYTNPTAAHLFAPHADIRSQATGEWLNTILNEYESWSPELQEVALGELRSLISGTLAPENLNYPWTMQSGPGGVPELYYGQSLMERPDTLAVPPPPYISDVPETIAPPIVSDTLSPEQRALQEQLNRIRQRSR